METSIVSSITSSPGACPNCPELTVAAPTVIIPSESTCGEFRGSPSGGLFTAPTGSCPAGSRLEYSTNNMIWTSTLPEYNQTVAVTVYTRCICEADGMVTSVVSSVSSDPDICPVVVDVALSKTTKDKGPFIYGDIICLLYTSPSPRDATLSRMPSSA